MFVTIGAKSTSLGPVNTRRASVIVSVIKTFEGIHAFLGRSIFNHVISGSGFRAMEFVVKVVDARRFRVSAAVCAQRTRGIPSNTPVATTIGASIKAFVIINASMEIVSRRTLAGEEGRNGALVGSLGIIDTRRLAWFPMFVTIRSQCAGFCPTHSR